VDHHHRLDLGHIRYHRRLSAWARTV
jgi:hypothetical protein